MVVCLTWVTRFGYSARTRVATRNTAPASKMIAISSVHQVAASGASPLRRSRAVSGWSSAVSKIAPAHGTTTTYSRAATRATR